MNELANSLLCMVGERETTNSNNVRGQARRKEERTGKVEGVRYTTVNAHKHITHKKKIFTKGWRDVLRSPARCRICATVFLSLSLLFLTNEFTLSLFYNFITSFHSISHSQFSALDPFPGRTTSHTISLSSIPSPSPTFPHPTHPTQSLSTLTSFLPGLISHTNGSG